MKKPYIIFIVISMFLSCNNNKSWKQSNSPLGTNINCIESIYGCSNKEKVIKITDARNGNVIVVKCDDCFKIEGETPTITVLPLKPEVIGAVLSQYDSFIDKAMKERDHNPNASFLLMSLHESMSRGNLKGVAQKILYYECFGEALP